MAISNIYMWYKLHNEKIEFKSAKLYISIIMLMGLFIINFYYINKFIKICTLIVVMVLCNYFLFNKKNNENIFVPIVGEIVILFSELIVSVFAFGILKLNPEIVTEKYFGTLFINFVIALLSILLVNINIFKKILKSFLKVTTNIPKKILFILLGLVIFISNFLFATSYYKIQTEYILIFNAGMIIIYSIIVLKMLEQKNKYIKINNKYNMTNNTLKELEQNVTRLKITNHENKNQLLTIRNMIKRGEDSDTLIKHIEKIVDTKIKDDEQLMFQTSTITNSMISSIIYSKMLTMKENNINTGLSVDRNIKDLYLSDMSEELSVEVCKIIGVYLDNAIEEVSKLKDKIINIEVYTEGKTLCIAISNNYEGEIDLVELDNPGYTTKENGHGYGLSLVAEIVNDNHKLTTDREIKDNIFKQILKIKM